MARVHSYEFNRGTTTSKVHFTSSRGGVILLAGYLGDNGSGLGASMVTSWPLQALAHGILLCPGARRGLVLGPISLVHVSDLGHQRIIRVRVRQQRTDWQEDLWYGQSRAPLFLENVKANAAVAVDVRVEHLGAERDLRGLEGVIRWEMNVYQK